MGILYRNIQTRLVPVTLLLGDQLATDSELNLMIGVISHVALELCVDTTQII